MLLWALPRRRQGASGFLETSPSFGVLGDHFPMNLTAKLALFNLLTNLSQKSTKLISWRQILEVIFSKSTPWSICFNTSCYMKIIRLVFMLNELLGLASINVTVFFHFGSCKRRTSTSLVIWEGKIVWKFYGY